MKRSLRKHFCISKCILQRGLKHLCWRSSGVLANYVAVITVTNGRMVLTNRYLLYLIRSVMMESYYTENCYTLLLFVLFHISLRGKFNRYSCRWRARLITATLKSIDKRRIVPNAKRFIFMFIANQLQPKPLVRQNFALITVYTELWAHRANFKIN